MNTRACAGRPAHAVAILVLSCFSGGLTGCGGGGGIAEPDGQGLAPGGSRSLSEIGLEAWVWHIDAIGAPLRQAVAPFALAGTSTKSAESERWRSAGFRIFEIPAELAESLEPGLPHADTVRHLWLGQPTRWARLDSANVRDVTQLRTSTDMHGPRAGRVELLTRSWIEPEARTGRVFRIELAVGWTPRSPVGRARRETMNGLFLSRSIAEGRALLLIPAGPDEDWLAPAPPAPPAPPSTPPDPTPDGEIGPADPLEQDVDDRGVAPIQAPEHHETDIGSGPELAPSRTIGEFLLITEAVLGRAPLSARRDVFVFIPRWP